MRLLGVAGGVLIICTWKHLTSWSMQKYTLQYHLFSWSPQILTPPKQRCREWRNFLPGVSQLSIKWFATSSYCLFKSEREKHKVPLYSPSVTVWLSQKERSTKCFCTHFSIERAKPRGNSCLSIHTTPSRRKSFSLVKHCSYHSHPLTFTFCLDKSPIHWLNFD